MAGRSLKYGVFWEPGENIAAFIDKWKQRVSEVEPDAVYLHHPVHSTFFLLMTERARLRDLGQSLAMLFAGTPREEVAFSGWHIFENDVATGGDTITLGLQPGKSLFQLQMDIAKAASAYSTSKVEYRVQWQGAFADSYHAFGFPFVGKHWLPHISVASVRKEGKKILAELNQDNSYPKHTLIQTIALYEIKGERHQPVERFSLSDNKK